MMAVGVGAQVACRPEAESRQYQHWRGSLLNRFARSTGMRLCPTGEFLAYVDRMSTPLFPKSKVDSFGALQDGEHVVD